MSLREIRDTVSDWVSRDQPWGEAVLIGVKRSAPRPPGARFVVGADGSFAGTISAGCIEADLREHLLARLPAGEPGIVNYGISDAMAAGVGLSCGGEIDVLLRCHDARDPVWIELLELLAAETPGALVTGVSSDVLGRQLLIRPDGSYVGSLGPADLDRDLAGNIDGLLDRDGADLVDTAGRQVFVDRVLPPRRLVIVGATPVAVALARMAVLADYRVTVVEPREGLARPKSFPDARLLVDWPESALDALELDEWTDVAVLAHDERLDVPALRLALAAGCRYVGLLGGRRTQRLRREALAEAGMGEPDTRRIRGPIGLDIGAVTPAEIAVAILAEILSRRRGGMSTVP